MPSLWANQDTEDSVSEDDDDSKHGFSYNITFNDRDTESVNSDVIATSWRKINSRPNSRSRSNSRSSSASLPGLPDNASSPAEFTPVMSRKPFGMVEQLSVDEPTIDDVPLVSMRSKSSSLKRSGAMTPTQRNSFRRVREKMKEKQNSLSDDRRSRSGSPAAHSDLENSLKFSDRGRRWTADTSAASGSYDVEMASRGRSSSSHSSGRAGDSESESELTASASIQARPTGRSSLPIIVVDKPLSARLAARATRHSESFDLDDRNDSVEKDELPKVDHKWKRKNASRIGRRQQQESEPVLTKFESKVTDLTNTSIDTGERDPPVVKDPEMISEESSIPQSKPSEGDQEENQIEAFPRRSIQADDNKIKMMREKARLSARRARQGGMSRAVREQEDEEFAQAPSPVLGEEAVVNNQSQADAIAQEPESKIQQAVEPPIEQLTESKSPPPSEAVIPAEKVIEKPVETTVEEAAVETTVEEAAAETTVEEAAAETTVEEAAVETPPEEPVREKVTAEELVKEETAEELVREETPEVIAEAPVEEPADVPPPLPPRDTEETEDKNEIEQATTEVPPQPSPEETQSKEEEVKALPVSETTQEEKTETQEEEKSQNVYNEPASVDTAISTAASDQTESTGEKDNFESPVRSSFHRRNVTRSRVKRPPPRMSISSDTSKTESEETPSTKSSDITEETKEDKEVQRVSERSTIQADDAELQRKREKARQAARRMRGGKYYAPSSQEDSPSVPAEPAVGEETQSPVRADSESKTERSESISSSRRLLSTVASKPPPRLPRKLDTDTKPAAESSQMDDEDLPKAGRFRRRNATRSERRGSSRRHYPPSPEHAEEDSSQAATIQSQGDEKLV